jgi:hypothetical protein
MKIEGRRTKSDGEGVGRGGRGMGEAGGAGKVYEREEVEAEIGRSKDGARCEKTIRKEKGKQSLGLGAVVRNVLVLVERLGARVELTGARPAAGSHRRDSRHDAEVL